MNDILIGTMLGDAGVADGKESASLSIRWEHSLKQEEYAVWKAQCIPNYSIYKRNRFDKRTNKTYSSITIYSTKDDYRDIRDVFYKKGKKIIPLKILNNLSPLSIAVWYMDDGNVYYNGNNCHITLGVDCFTEREKANIIKYFYKKYKVNFKKTGNAIRLTSKKDCEVFMNIISQFIHPSLKYKTLEYVICIHKLKPKKIRKEVCGRPVLQIEVCGEIVKEWKSIKEAALKLLISENSIYCNLCGKSKLCNGFKWEYK